MSSPFDPCAHARSEEEFFHSRMPLVRRSFATRRKLEARKIGDRTHRMNEFSTWKKSVAALSDESLLQKTQTLASDERARTAWLVAHLAEVFRRDLVLKRGF